MNDTRTHTHARMNTKTETKSYTLLAIRLSLVLGLGMLLAWSGYTQSTTAPPYTPPVIPSIFTAQDITSSVAAFADAQSAYVAMSDLIVKHDADLYGPAGVISNLKSADAINAGSILNLSNSLAASQPKPLILINLSACAAIPPATLAANQLPLANSAFGVLGGYKMMWISNPTTEIVTCPVTVPDQAYYYILGAFITPASGHSMHVEFPAGVNVSGEFAIPNTGSWTSVFVDVQAPLPVMLPAGTSTVLLNFESGGFDFGGIALRHQ